MVSEHDQEVEFSMGKRDFIWTRRKKGYMRGVRDSHRRYTRSYIGCIKMNLTTFSCVDGVLLELRVLHSIPLGS